MIHHVSLFRGAKDNVPKPAEFTWEAFCAALLPHQFRPPADKLKCDAWSPAQFKPGTLRANENVIGISLWVGDYDSESEDAVANSMAEASTRGWAYAMHTTWSHAKKPMSARLIIPLSQSVPPAEWPAVWDTINNALGGNADPTCKDSARLYFGAFAPIGDEEKVFHDVSPGGLVDLNGLPLTPAARQAASVSQEKVSRDQLVRFARALKKRRDDRLQEHGILLLKIAEGSPFAEPGNRDNTIFGLSNTLARRYPEADPDSLAEHFRLSLQLMDRQSPGTPTVRDVAYKIKRAQQRIFEQQAAKENEVSSHNERLIMEAFRSDRKHPYTPEEAATIPEGRWILQKGKSFYVRVLDMYRGPYQQEEAQNEIVRNLSPARTAGVELYTINQQGEVAPKSLSQLVREYGIAIDQVIADLSAKKPYFYELTRTMVEAPAPLRDIKSVYHESINRWLEALAGPERAHLLKAWIAHVTLLDDPCTALFITGPKHLGKTVLPEGLARLWNGHGTPTMLQDVLGTNFNEAQLSCPLTFADEVLPKDFRGRVMHAELRQYIQERRRTLKRKFLPEAVILGAARIIICANNENVLSTGDSLSAHDIGAIIDRFLWIPGQAEATAVLKDVDTSGWVKNDEIAEHALWLRDNNTFKSNGRFLVHSDDRMLHSRLITGRGPRGAILQFCVGYLLNPQLVDNHAAGQYLIRIYKGKLLINVQVLLACWSLYVTNEKCPSTGALSNAIGALSTDERLRRPTPGKKGTKRPNYRVIDRDHLVAWAEHNGYATEDQIDMCLSIDTEERVKHLAN